MYYFDHYPDITGGDKGMDHSMDLPYTFGFQQGYKIPVTSPFAGQNISAADISLAADFRTLLTNFAKSGWVLPDKHVITSIFLHVFHIDFKFKQAVRQL